VQQAKRVRVLRGVHDLADAALLNDAAAIHHGKVIRHRRGNGEIVGDEDDAHPEGRTEIAE
jgi:hypothetical protein